MLQRFGAALLAATLAGCDGAPETPAAMTLVEAARVSMGSEVRLSAWTADEASAQAAFEAVFDEFDRLDRLLSVWQEGSDVQRLNGAAGREPVPLTAETRELLRLAHEVSEWTGGKFDVTFGGLSGIWRFDHDMDGHLPSSTEIVSRLPLIDYRALALDEAAGTAFLPRTGMRVHLGGIGKGYAVDRAADLLRSTGIHDFMIQSGGDLYVAGRSGGRPWRGGIQDPRGPAGQVFAALDLENVTLSTSGDYERFFFVDGRRYHHILDPDRGVPARGSRSVTIVTERAALADALSTGVFVLGPEEGLRLVERLPGVEAVIVTARNEVRVSSGLRGRLQVVRPPTDAP